MEKILDKRIDNGRVKYLLKWQGYPEHASTWEPVEYLKCPDLIERYEQEEKEKSRPVLTYVSDHNHPPYNNNKKFEYIVGVTNENKGSNHSGTLLYLIKLEGLNIATTHSATIINNTHPQMVISFYESIIEWSEVKETEVPNLDLSTSVKKDFKDLPEAVIGATKVKGKLRFLMRWTSPEERIEFVWAKEAYLKWPQLVIDFFTSKLDWEPISA